MICNDPYFHQLFPHHYFSQFEVLGASQVGTEVVDQQRSLLLASELGLPEVVAWLVAAYRQAAWATFRQAAWAALATYRQAALAA